MKDLADQYRSAPRKASPRHIDQRILLRAAQQANSRETTVTPVRGGLPVWMSVTAACSLAGLCFLLVTRIGGGPPRVTEWAQDTASGIESAAELSVDRQIVNEQLVSEQVSVEATTQAAGVDRNRSAKPAVAGQSVAVEIPLAVVATEVESMVSNPPELEEKTEQRVVSAAEDRTAESGRAASSVANASARQKRSRLASAEVAETSVPVTTVAENVLTAEPLEIVERAENTETERADSLALEAQSAASVPLQTARSVVQFAETAGTASRSSATKSLSAKSPAPAAPDADAVTTQILVEDENWILFQPGSSFTIQLASSENADYLREFARIAKVPAPVALYRLPSTSGSRYALLQGVYNSDTDVRRALAELTERAREFKPWIRKIGALQDALKQSE